MIKEAYKDNVGWFCPFPCIGICCGTRYNHFDDAFITSTPKLKYQEAKRRKLSKLFPLNWIFAVNTPREGMNQPWRSYQSLHWQCLMSMNAILSKQQHWKALICLVSAEDSFSYDEAEIHRFCQTMASFDLNYLFLVSSFHYFGTSIHDLWNLWGRFPCCTEQLQ